MVKFEVGFESNDSTQVVTAGHDTVTIVDADLLFGAQYSRTTHDLILTGESGKSIIVVDYFDHDQPPALSSPDGAMLTASTVKALAGPLAPGQYAQAGDQQVAASIGKV